MVECSEAKEVSAVEHCECMFVVAFTFVCYFVCCVMKLCLALFFFVCMFVCSSICMYVHQCCCSYVVYMCSMRCDFESAEGHEHISNFARYITEMQRILAACTVWSHFFCTAVAIRIAMHSSSMLG